MICSTRPASRRAFRPTAVKPRPTGILLCPPARPARSPNQGSALNGVEGDVLDVLGELAQFLGVVALDLRHVVDVGAFDQFPFPGAQIVELRPQIGAEGVGAFRAFAGAGQQAVVAVVLIEAADGVLAVLDLSASTL